MKILAEKTVLESNLFKVNTLDLEFTNKEKATWYSVSMKYPSVFIVPLTEQNEVYLITQYRPVIQKTQLEVTAGFINDGESVIVAGNRELREETGLVANHWQELHPVQLTSSTVRAQLHVVVAKGFTQGQTEREPSEEITVVKMPMLEAVEKVLTGEITDGPSIIALLLVNTMLGKGEIT